MLEQKIEWYKTDKINFVSTLSYVRSCIVKCKIRMETACVAVRVSKAKNCINEVQWRHH